MANEPEVRRPRAGAQGDIVDAFGAVRHMTGSLPEAISINCEGCEYAVVERLAGAPELLRALNYIDISWHVVPVARRLEIRCAAEAALERAGFELVYFSVFGWQGWAKKTRPAAAAETARRLRALEYHRTCQAQGIGLATDHADRAVLSKRGCAERASARPECGSHIMWSPANHAAWGCFCCPRAPADSAAAAGELGEPNPSWELWRVGELLEPAEPGPEPVESPPVEAARGRARSDVS